MVEVNSSKKWSLAECCTELRILKYTDKVFTCEITICIERFVGTIYM